MAEGGQPRVQVVLVGEEKVGKTCLFRALCASGPFGDSYRTTVGPPRPQTITHTRLGTQDALDLTIVDTAGQLRMRNYTLSGVSGSKGVLLTFDLTRAYSFKQLEEEEWLRHIRTKAGEAVVMLVGNKVDLADQREVAHDEAKAWSHQNDLLYAEVSAKDPCGVKQALDTLLQHIP